MNGITTDIQLAIRSLIRNPLISILAIVTLALGIGANTAIFSVLNATLLSPLPYPGADRLVAVWGVMPNRDIDTWPASPGMVERYRREGAQFEDFAAASNVGHAFRQRPDADPVQIDAVTMTWNLFDVLGVRPALGRPFAATDAAFNHDEVPEGVPAPANTFNPPNAVMLGHAFWRDRFGSDPEAVGSTIWLDNVPATVVGVMPPDFRLFMPGGVNARPDVFEVLRVDIAANEAAGNVFLNVIARLDEGVALRQAQTEMDAISARLRDDMPIYRDNDFSNRLVPLKSELTEDIDAMLLILAAVVALVLLIACANVGTLLLTRSTRRRRELAIRGALGAGSARLTTQLMVESAVLALMAGAVGVVLADWLLDALVALAPGDLPRAEEIGIDGGVLVFALGASLLTGLLTGLVPTLRALRVAPLQDLRQGDARGGGRTAALRSAFVVAEVALSVILLFGAGLLLKSFIGIVTTDPGFRSEQVTTFEVSLPGYRYDDPAVISEYNRSLLAGVRALPGVTGAALAENLPTTGSSMTTPALVEGRTVNQPPLVQIGSVSDAYFRTMGIPLLEGRTFRSGDDAEAPPVAVVNEAFVRAYLDGENPLGRRARTYFDPAMREIVGVVGSGIHGSLTEPEQPKYYYPATQRPPAGFRLVVRSEAPVTGLIPAVQAVAQRTDPEVPLGEIATLRELLSRTTAQPRFYATTLGAFAALALVLALTGFFAVLSQSVSARQRELGVRLAVAVAGVQRQRPAAGRGGDAGAGDQ